MTAEMLAPVVEKVRMVVSSPVRLVSGNGFTLVRKRQLARLLDLPSGGTKTLRIGGPRADAYFATLAKRINTKAQDAEFIVATRSRVIVKPSVNARALDVPRTADKLLAAALRPSRRSAPMVVATEQPERTTAEARKMGITGLVSSYTTIYGGRREPRPQRAARRRSDRQDADRAGNDVLLQRDDRRAQRRQGLPRGAGDHQRRAADGARRRRLPGLDDGVQRRVRGGPRHHRADEPRPLHQPLPAGSRRHRQLPRPRPEVRQRHRELAAAADVRGLVGADGQPLRDAAAPARRVRGR